MNASASQPARERLIADQRANEPSMEEILASIRRIISESEAVVAAPVVSQKADSTAQAPSSAQARSDPLPLHRGAQHAPLQILQPTESKSIFDEPLDLRGSILPKPELNEVKAVPKADPSLLSHESGRSVSAAFSALSAAKTAQDSLDLDGMAREMLRPMLKTWLDDNLPTIVERLVRAEIERVARGTR